MSTDRALRASRPLPVPRTAVPMGIADPVEQARAELKATLAAIEEKANVPKRVGEAADRSIEDARDFARRNPSAARAVTAAVAVAVGVTVWGIVRLIAR
ncbi:hypothetical protein [Microbacterium sp. zg.Y1084]|uniref:hypothetical protein n=1 Tax=Microbacterium sp. zg.Y1084 TaxID=2969667 RepID=UPI00214CC646|nr:hypothetical protein [Microbacterium sp. zg.Y1084]MCR2813253.1 hypothetical protein [Microbacterium sp. zg.Y1084]